MGRHLRSRMVNLLSSLLFFGVCCSLSLAQLDLPPKDPEGDSSDGVVEEYELPDGMEPNDNGYGGEPELKCRLEEKVSYEDVCEPYVEEMCYTQNVEQCEDKPYNNCTGSVKLKWTVFVSMLRSCSVLWNRRQTMKPYRKDTKYRNVRLSWIEFVTLTTILMLSLRMITNVLISRVSTVRTWMSLSMTSSVSILSSLNARSQNVELEDTEWRRFAPRDQRRHRIVTLIRGISVNWWISFDQGKLRNTVII